jgi:hypothetical protein
MPDADDFDVESLRALLRGEPPSPAKGTKPKTDSMPKPARAAARGKASGEKTKASPSAPGRGKGPRSTAPGKKPRKP